MIRRIWTWLKCRVMGHVPVQVRTRKFLGSFVLTARCERCRESIGKVDDMRWFVLGQDAALRDSLRRRHQEDDA